jgi:Phosphotransferase enzyme family
MNVTNLLQSINEQHGTDFELLERYSSGEQGAFAIADQGGNRYVLKWGADDGHLDRLQKVSIVTDVLRNVGYPAPRYCLLGIVHGYSYTIQEGLPGVPMGVLSAPILPRLLELNKLQARLANSEQSDWPGPVVDTVMMGGDGYCLLDSLRIYSSTTEELLNVLQAVVLAHRNEHFETNDVVHFDFNTSNILIENGQVSGIIDWDDTCAGDCTFDLATLLFYSYEALDVREQLLLAIRKRVSPGVLSLYMAHMILRQVDWSIRFHDRATVDYYLRVAQKVLRDGDRE